MDAGHFDCLTRTLSHGLTRRTLTSLVTGLGLGSLALGRSLGSRRDVAQAKKGGGKKKGGGGKGNKKNDNKKNDTKTLECSGRGHILCPVVDFVTGEPLRDPITGGVLSGCVNLLTHTDHCGQCGKVCPKDPELGARDFACRDGSCVCTGVVCPNGRCCPADYASCIGDGEGCCPTGYYGCPNSQPVDCCPNGYTCGGTCGQECCRPGG